MTLKCTKPTELGKTLAFDPHDPIIIDGDANFSDTALDNGWIGDGSSESPYIIEDLEISVGESSSHCISIGNTRANFTILHCNLTGASVSPGSGIHLDNVTFGKISDNILENNYVSIYLSLSHYLLIENNTCSTSDYGIRLLQDSSYNNLTRKTCPSNANTGISLESGSNHNIVDNNTCNDNKYGISLYHATLNIVANNSCLDNTYEYDGSGIDLHSNSNENDIINNTCVNNHFGIFIDSSIDNTLSNNTCQYGTVGILSDGADLNILTNNTCTNNDYGISLQDSRWTQVSWNILEDNLVNGYDFSVDPGSLLNSFEYNYWSDYDGYDANGDFFGDTPYLISGNENNQDPHPLMLYPGTPITWLSPTEDLVLYQGAFFRCDLNATAYGGLDHWWLNDTENFEIDENGIITNSTTLSLGTYGLHVIVYDTQGDWIEGYFAVDIVKLEGSIIINGDVDFELKASDMGFAGDGTSTSPYRIRIISIDLAGDFGHCINISNTRAYFVISGCTLVGANVSQGAGIYLRNVTNGILIDNTCSNNQYGIHLVNSTYNHMMRNNCSDNINTGMCLEDGSNINELVNNSCSNMVYGIALYSSHSNTIEENNCTLNTNDGILVDSGNKNIFSRNLCNNNARYGFYMTGSSSSNSFTNNNCSENDEYGIYSNSLNPNLLTDNLCVLNNVGIVISGPITGGLIANNTCNYNSVYGILIQSTHSTVVIHNFCSHNARGIAVIIGGENNVTWNTFLDNSLSGGIWEGYNDFIDYNYWSDYTGYDEDLDGIGDTVYLIYSSEPEFWQGEDPHPLMMPHTSLTWTMLLVDQLIELGNFLRYNLNVTQFSPLEGWWLNDTRFFVIDDDGVITAPSIVPVGVYGIQVSVMNSWGNILDGRFTVNIVDTTPPSWVKGPSDRYIECGESLDYQISATDLSSINYWINDTTYFSISQSGIIRNKTFLPCGVYGLSVNVNDTFGNHLVGIFTLNVIDTTSPIWIETPCSQIIEYGVGFYYNLNSSDLSGLSSWWVNDTFFYSIDSSGIIVNNTFLPVGTYGLRICVNDTLGNVLETNITIEVVDTTPPVLLSLVTDKYLQQGVPFEYQINASDLSGIDWWHVNNTIEFEIDTQGRITSIGILQTGEYGLNVTASDPYGNELWFVFTIYVTPADTTGTTTATSTATTSSSTNHTSPTLQGGMDPVVILFIVMGAGCTAVVAVVIILQKRRS